MVGRSGSSSKRAAVPLAQAPIKPSRRNQSSLCDPRRFRGEGWTCEAVREVLDAGHELFRHGEPILVAEPVLEAGDPQQVADRGGGIDESDVTLAVASGALQTDKEVEPLAVAEGHAREIDDGMLSRRRQEVVRVRLKGPSARQVDLTVQLQQEGFPGHAIL